MNKKGRRYFRDDISRTFIIYALIPITIITFVMYVAAFFVWNTSIIYQTKEKNAKITTKLEETVTHFKYQIESIAQDKAFYKLLYNPRQKSSVYEKLYFLSNQIEEKVDFYIVDNNLKVLAGSSKEVPYFIQKDSSISWGITKRMKESPYATILECNNIYKDSLKRSQLVIGRSIMDKEELQGYVVLILYGDEFIKTSGSPTTQIIVTDKYDNIFLETTPGFSNSLDKIRSEFKKGESYVTIGKDKYYNVKTSVLEDDLCIYTFTPLGNFLTTFIWAGLFFGLVLLILFLAMFIIAKKIAIEKTKIIDNIVEAFEQVQQGHLDVRLDIKSYNEFEIIGESYNLMLCSIKNLISINEEKVRQNILSEIKQLESQFNPHFLFNTLEHIRYMAKLDPEAASKMIVNLSTLLRYSINNNILDVTVKEDLEYTKSYLQIQQYRFSNRFKYVIYTENGAENCIIPKLIIQPIIENAIKHGFGDKENLIVRIKVCFLGEHLVIVIFDDGVGMEEKNLKEIQQLLQQTTNVTTHIGLYNVHRRVKLMYGDDYGLEIKSERDEGTVIKIVLPIHKRGENYT